MNVDDEILSQDEGRDICLTNGLSPDSGERLHYHDFLWGHLSIVSPISLTVVVNDAYEPWSTQSLELSKSLNLQIHKSIK